LPTEPSVLAIAFASAGQLSALPEGCTSILRRKQCPNSKYQAVTAHEITDRMGRPSVVLQANVKTEEIPVIARRSPLSKGHWNPLTLADPLALLFSKFGQMRTLEVKNADFTFKSSSPIEQFLGVYSFPEPPQLGPPSQSMEAANSTLEIDRMMAIRPFAAILLSVVCTSILSGQDVKAASSAAAPPNVLLLVHQEILPGRTSDRQRLETNISRACDRLDAPSFWIDLQSLTGPREALFFDSFDSFEQLEESDANWRQFYAGHPDLARVQDDIDASVGSERTIVALRRDDVGYLADNIDLSETRFLRILEVRLIPGHENDFVEALRILADAYTKIKADTPWLVYQVNLGMTSPSFLILVPMSELGQNDDLLSLKDNLLSAEGEDAAERLKQIARESYASTESNLYAVKPEMSHVSKEFAAGDADFWRRKAEPNARPETRPLVKPAVSSSHK
jgi:hypothetical protein